MLNINHILLRRLVASWLLISLAIGGGLYFYGIEQIDDQIVDLALAKADKLSGPHLSLLNNPKADRDTLERLTADLAREHFVVVELYDREHRKVVEQANPLYEGMEERINHAAHHFPQDSDYHYERFTLGDRTVVQVMAPLKDAEARIAGYFEGVYLVDQETLSNLNRELMVTLSVTLVTVLLTTLALYPVIVSLNRDVVRFSRDLLQGNIELMEVLGSAIAKRDSDTHIHNYRVSIYAVRLAEAVRLDNVTIRNLIAGAFLHDAGKIGISDNILLKPEKLTEEEFAVMKTHVTLGVDILAKSTWLQAARDVVEFHHEKFDGSGYMRGFKGDEIPINARIFAIVDVFDALTSKRPYKQPFPFDEAIAILRRDAGSHFDPRLVDTFSSIAESLHHEISDASSARVEAILQELIDRYFFPG